jgi:ADP-ribosyl-[dinitrogen reductase] hydrolase
MQGASESKINWHEVPDAIFFYSKNRPYYCFTNFSDHGFKLDGEYWPTSEHYFQAHKFMDEKLQDAVRHLPTGRKAFEFCRNHDSSKRSDWDLVKDGFMRRAVLCKFLKHPDLKAKLLNTGERSLVEDSPVDSYWGCGEDGYGKNMLGQILTETREILRTNIDRVYDNLEKLRWLFRLKRIDLKEDTLIYGQPSQMSGPPDFDRVEGMLLGLAIGDALGATTESKLAAQRNVEKGQITDYLPNKYADYRSVGLPTDDSQMAFWTLEQLLIDNELVPEHLAQCFCNGHIFGIGKAVRKFISNYHDNRLPWYLAGVPSSGNGAIMRIASVLLPHLRRGGYGLYADAAIAASVTHNDPASTSACVAFVDMLWQLLYMRAVPPSDWWLQAFCKIAGRLEGDKKYSPRLKNINYQGPVWQFTQEEVSKAVNKKISTLDACNLWGSGAYMLETVPSFIYILTQYGQDPEKAIIRAVNDTKDNDSIAAIVGAAVGALHGKSKLPTRWIKGLLGRTREKDDGHVFELIEQARSKFG